MHQQAHDLTQARVVNVLQISVDDSIIAVDDRLIAQPTSNLGHIAELLSGPVVSSMSPHIPLGATRV
jgi:hypothetical protein